MANFSFFLSSNICSDCVIMDCPLWREDESVIYSCCCVSATQSFAGMLSGDINNFVSNLRLTQSGKSGSSICLPPQLSSPIILPGYSHNRNCSLILTSARTTQKTPLPKLYHISMHTSPSCSYTVPNLRITFQTMVIVSLFV
jgi:hypothetical protein